MLSNIGVPGMVLFFNIIFFAIGLFILYIVISKAIRDGINKSVVGQFINQKNADKENKKTFLESYLDNDK